jgi:serine/threonine protein kinase
MRVQILTRQPHSFEADVWAYGVLLSELFAGKRPLPRSEIEALRKGSHASAVRQALVKATREAVVRTMAHRPELCRAVLGCLEEDPARRCFPRAEAGIFFE